MKQRHLTTMEWANNECELAMKKEMEPVAPENEVGIVVSENEDRMNSYIKGCYDSALKALKSLCDDGHSGMSIGITLSILNRLVKHKPLTPIEDKDEEWYEPSFRPTENYQAKTYQSKRYTALFKDVFKDGHVEYRDINLVNVYDLDDIGAGGFHNGLADIIVHEMHPITFPYYPAEKSYALYSKDYGDKDSPYQLREYQYLINPQGEKEEVGKYYICEDEIREIDKEKFEKLKKELE